MREGEHIWIGWDLALLTNAFLTKEHSLDNNHAP
jgi:hypothetical protein